MPSGARSSGIDALNTTTSDMIRSTSELLATQSVDIHRQAASSTVKVEALRRALRPAGRMERVGDLQTELERDNRAAQVQTFGKEAIDPFDGCHGDGSKDHCGLVQLRHSYDLAEMYGENYGYRSGLNQSMVEHLTHKVRMLQRFVEPRMIHLSREASQQ